jgi:metallo-beta-lactamase family protein
LSAGGRARLKCLGAVGTVTGSKYLLDTGRARLLIDCGLFQGLKSLRLRNWEPLPLDAAGIDATLLTHAHLDHCGFLPLLWKQGFRGPIHCTAPTRDLARLILLDSAHIQEEDAELANAQGYSRHHPARPLTTVGEAEAVFPALHPAPAREWVKLPGGDRFQFIPNGHILGSVSILVETEDGRVLFSGDLGRAEPLILPPGDPRPDADLVVIESTYGDRLHPPLSPSRELARIVCDAWERRGTLMIPAFAVGRTQELLFLLDRLRRESRIPSVPVFVDSPMALEATRIFLMHPDWHRLSTDEARAVGDSFTPVVTPVQSDNLARSPDPCIIIAGSGMISGGRVLKHLGRRLPDPRHTVLLSGFQAAGTRGRLLQEGIGELKMHGRYVPVGARVEMLSNLSGHADQGELLRWLGPVPGAHAIVVTHGEPQAAECLRVRIRDETGLDATIPAQGDSIAVA